MKTWIAVLGVALVASNLGWAWLLLDRAVGASYAAQGAADCRSVAEAALALGPVLACPGEARGALLERVEAARGPADFEKEGVRWYGAVGLEFDAAGRLSAVRPVVEPL
jgi:hypothetical protein